MLDDDYDGTLRILSSFQFLNNLADMRWVRRIWIMRVVPFCHLFAIKWYVSRWQSISFIIHLTILHVICTANECVKRSLDPFWSEYDSAAMGCRGQFILPLKYAYQIYQLFSEQLWNDIVSQSDIIFVMNVCPLKISAVLNQCCGISKRCGLCELT